MTSYFAYVICKLISLKPGDSPRENSPAPVLEHSITLQPSLKPPRQAGRHWRALSQFVKWTHRASFVGTFQLSWGELSISTTSESRETAGTWERWGPAFIKDIPQRVRPETPHFVADYQLGFHSAVLYYNSREKDSATLRTISIFYL